LIKVDGLFVLSSSDLVVPVVADVSLVSDDLVPAIGIVSPDRHTATDWSKECTRLQEIKEATARVLQRHAFKPRTVPPEDLLRRYHQKNLAEYGKQH
jgi:hypothetical protein